MQCLRISNSLVGRMHHRFGNNFQQRGAGAIQVDAAHALEILVQRFARVFFEMGTRELNLYFAARRRNDGDLATLHDRDLELADLVALGKIGIEIVFSCEDRTPVDFRADRHAEPDRPFDRTFVQHRQRTGQREIHDAGLRVWRGAEGGRRVRKNLRLRRQLRVGFQPDDDFPIHANSPSPQRRKDAKEGARRKAITELKDQTIGRWRAQFMFVNPFSLLSFAFPLRLRAFAVRQSP